MSALMDSNTQAKAKKLISGALQPALDSLSKDANGIVHKNIPFMKDQAIELMAALGIIAIAIIAFVWYERNRYAKTLKILTYQIDKIPVEHQSVYDDLTGRIKSHAQMEGVEPFLDKVLKSQGI